MGWFSKSKDGFFLATVVPNGEGARVAQFLGVVNGEVNVRINDPAQVQAALTALRPSAPKAKADIAAPIRVKKSGSTSPAPGKDEPVETPKSVLKALSNASNAMEAFKKPGGKK